MTSDAHPTLGRAEYAAIFGPTTGDRVALADTCLEIEIERDSAAGSYGDESVYGGGKAIRDGSARLLIATRHVASRYRDSGPRWATHGHDDER